MSTDTRKRSSKADDSLNTAALAHNLEALEFGRTCQSSAAGIAAGILGLTGINGFLLYLATVLFQAVIWETKAKGGWSLYFPDRNSLTWSHGNGLLTFVLLWVFFYGMVHMLSLLRNTLALPCSSVLSGGPVLRPVFGEIHQVRGRKRALKQTLTRQQRLERRIKREEKEAARKQYTFMERINIRRMKNLLSPSQQFPGRLVPENEVALPEKPTLDVFIKSHFKTQYYSVSEALLMHREIQAPNMYNNPNAPVRLRLELNMNTERQTKMVTSSDEIVPVPFPFKHNEKRTILAFVQDTKLQDLAVQSGAEIAVGQDMIKKIIKGQFRIDDYDFCVSHVDMASFILPLRGILKTRFPTRSNGGLGENLPELIEKFKNGVKLNIKADPVYPTWGLSDCVVGRLSMPDEQIEANVAAVVAAACAHRNPALGSFVNRALLMTIPGEEHYALNVSSWLPVASEEEIEKIEKRKNKKGKKKEEQKKEEDEDEEPVAVASA
ncbi:unnamed protein product [Caenorhabditis auriculariae]|uniref:Uncharacterized protein n=1 Tax=Caenorhabditis auriculariae TaxID=2777116 RepID=A0A8S1HNB4_9PELO|nr:unnamed protein product [Caenorhabditis auriculariae]